MALPACAGLKWKITIGGQASVSPTTAYGAPVIESFAGTALVDASTDGGDYILINGAFFSLQKYLDYVTYGPSGSEVRRLPTHAARDAPACARACRP